MSKNTSIEWCDSTVNPTMGCDGCELWIKKKKACYAGVLHARYGGQKGYAPKFETVTMFPGRMAETLKWSDLTGTKRPDKPWLNGSPRVVFVSDMSDALSQGVPFEFLKAEIIDTVIKSPHIYMWLTKRPARMVEFATWLLEKHGITWPQNLWAGTSVTDQTTAQSRVTSLHKMPATLFISAEPLWSEVDFLWPVDGLGCHGQPTIATLLYSIALVITGGESGKSPEECKASWIEKVVAACQTVNVPVFVKQLGGACTTNEATPDQWPPGTELEQCCIGTRVALKDPKGGDPDEWPAHLRVREFQKVKPSLTQAELLT